MPARQGHRPATRKRAGTGGRDAAPVPRSRRDRGRDRPEGHPPITRREGRAPGRGVRQGIGAAARPVEGETDRVRADKRAFSRDNVETRQYLGVAAGVVERAPAEPGFFDIRRDEETLFEGAAHFADVREGDLSRAASREPGDDVVRDAVLMNSLPDPLASLWLLLLMGVAASAWMLQERGA